VTMEIPMLGTDALPHVKLNQTGAAPVLRDSTVFAVKIAGTVYLT